MSCLGGAASKNSTLGNPLCAEDFVRTFGKYIVGLWATTSYYACTTCTRSDGTCLSLYTYYCVYIFDGSRKAATYMYTWENPGSVGRIVAIIQITHRLLSLLHFAQRK